MDILGFINTRSLLRPPPQKIVSQRVGFFFNYKVVLFCFLIIQEPACLTNSDDFFPVSVCVVRVGDGGGVC